jgi:hypothetical protein
MDSKILQELNNLNDKCNNIKTILTEDIASIAKQISEKVDLTTYKYTDEESQVVQEIEEIIEYINSAIGEFYKYEEDIKNNDEIEGEDKND